jgi:cytochrome c-type biogenesis protein CcmH/NrfG
MKEESITGYIKKETVYIMVAVSLLVGFLGGIVLAVYKSPGAASSQVQVTTQKQQGQGHDIPALEAQVTATPNDPAVWVHLANAYFDANEATKAIKAYNKALELAPGNPDVLTDLGVMYRRNNQPDEALLAFDRAIKASPSHEQSRLNKGVVLLYDKKNQSEAFRVWEELLTINPMVTVPSGELLKDFMKEVQK